MLAPDLTFYAPELVLNQLAFGAYFFRSMQGIAPLRLESVPIESFKAGRDKNGDLGLNGSRPSIWP